MQGSSDLQFCLNQAFDLPEGEGRAGWLRALARMCEFLCEYETDGSAAGSGPNWRAFRANPLQSGKRILLQGTDPDGRSFRIWEAGEFAALELRDGAAADYGRIENREIFYDGSTGNLYEIPHRAISNGAGAGRTTAAIELLPDNSVGGERDGEDDESKADVS